jgi:hypothetical protein
MPNGALARGDDPEEIVCWIADHRAMTSTILSHTCVLTDNMLLIVSQCKGKIEFFSVCATDVGSLIKP